MTCNDIDDLPPQGTRGNWKAGILVFPFILRESSILFGVINIIGRHQ